MFARTLARIASLIAKDARTGSRDQMMTYMLLSPILLGLMFALLMPILEGAAPLFVVSEQLDPVHVDALAAHGEIEFVSDRAAVEARVLGRDDATGVVPSSAGAGADGLTRAELLPEVIIEGDEPEALRSLATAILDHAARERVGETLTTIEVIPVGGEHAQLRLIVAALLAFSIPVIVGIMLGFTILEEKITNTNAVYRTSALRFGEYIAGKLALALSLSLVMVIPAVAMPFGLGVDWLGVELMTLASLPFALSLGLCIGVFAKDQLGAIAVLKASLPLWTSLPILGFVLPDDWLWTQWPFANHWAVQGYFAALSGRGQVWSEAGLAFAAGLPVLALTTWLLYRRLGYSRCSQRNTAQRE